MLLHCRIPKLVCPHLRATLQEGTGVRALRRIRLLKHAWRLRSHMSMKLDGSGVIWIVCQKRRVITARIAEAVGVCEIWIKLWARYRHVEPRYILYEDHRPSPLWPARLPCTARPAASRPPVPAHHPLRARTAPVAAMLVIIALGYGTRWPRGRLGRGL